MDGKGVSGSYLVLSEEKNESLYPMVFGVSCAFVALRLLSEPKNSDEKLSEIRNGMLLGSAHLLGLLIWRVQREGFDSGNSELLQRLEFAQRQIEELKKLRSEDAKANEKVVRIFAAQEQRWFEERKKLRQQIGALMNDLRVLEAEKNKAISELNEKLHANELLFKSKDKLIEDEHQKRHNLEEKLKKAENSVEELKETASQEAQHHSNEIMKHKTAFIELVSNQRQLEAEMSRALRQVESAKQELDLVLEQKEQSALMTQKLSAELIKMRRDLEQKDQILSAMLRKSKLDTAEKQMLLEEVKFSKAKKKQAELETERLKAHSESRHEKHSLRSMLSKHVNSKAGASFGGKGVRSNGLFTSNSERSRSNQFNFHLEHEHPDFSLVSDQYSSQGNQDPTNFKQLEGWVRAQAEKYRNVVEQRHHLELDAFAEQLRLKDEKLEALRWRLLSTELESKRLQSHVEGLECKLTQLKQENLKLEASLLNCEADLHSLREKLGSQVHNPSCEKTSSNSNNDPTSSRDIWSRVKIIKKNPGEKALDVKTSSEDSEKLENVNPAKSFADIQHKDIVLTLQSPEKEIGEVEVDVLNPDTIQQECSTSSSVVKYVTKKNDLLWRMDFHALGISYKIKRLKQQLFMLEKLAGKQDSHKKHENNSDNDLGFHALMSLLNKQIGRYQSLEGKTDDLCQRMHEKVLDVKGGDSATAKSKEQTRMLEHYLEETFQLQRYIVATGQKWMELQDKIVSGFIGVADVLDTPASFDMKKFADNVSTLFREVQRGFEVRTARIIGDLEGTLACDGIIHFRK